ncbi:hypothetical protein HYPSUDRAFT_43841 [Hypholoma sublateritium FD-334 SS-4]|uniref:Uncharacterized protein n=1 Tax=Hypholoma sublateritium (strain FD-334 SS-4) TaxID=945553 RepID=A0A0D2PIU8_HYPSF|nr:hypothetical protein HYPSUDRAFT_43841 [Hypholoma sublateritium FD-334 SS-4]
MSKSDHPTCGSLPSWLATTFMSLARKHPLRLLLPADLAETSISKSDKRQKSKEPKYEEVPATSDGIFAFKVPERIVDDMEPPNAKENIIAHQSLLSQNHTPIRNDAYIDYPIPEYSSAPLPFSTPGPGSHLGSTTDTTTVGSFATHASSSPTLYATDYYAQETTRFEPHTPIYYTDETHKPTDYHSYAENTDSSDDSNMLLTDVVDNPLFMDIFANPGPVYSFCAPTPLHFDSPTEDPLTSSPSSAGHDISQGEIDFQWKPFDLRKLPVPSMPERAAFAYGPSEREALGATGQVDLVDAIRICDHTARKASPLAIVPSPSPVAPISPSPFRFAPPPEESDDYLSQNHLVQVSSDHREQHEEATPRKVAFAPVPGIFISPLHPSRGQSRSPKPASQVSHHVVCLLSVASFALSFIAALINRRNRRQLSRMSSRSRIISRMTALLQALRK